VDGSLEYQFKIDVPTGPLEHGAKKVDEFEKTLEKLNVHGGRHAESLEHKIRHEFGGVGHAVNYAKNEVHDLLETLGLVMAFEIGEKIVEKLFDIGKEALDAAAAAERMDLAFELSLGKEGGSEMVEYLEKINGLTEFTDVQLKGWGKSLLNAGVAAEDLDKFLTAGLDVAAKSPDKLEGMGRAIQALSRASLTGMVDTRQLRGLSIGIDQLRTLPKFAHMSVKQLKKEMTDGKLTKDDLLAVIAGPDKILGDLGLRAGQTMEARMLHLRHIPEEVFQKLRKTEAFDRVSAALGRMLEKLDPEGPVGKRIFAALEHALGTFADIVDGIDFEEMANVIVEDVVPALEAMLGAIKPTIEAVERVIRGFHEMHDLIYGPKPKNAALDDFDRRQKAAKDRAEKDDEHPAFLDKGIDVGGGAKAWHSKFHMVGQAAGDGLAVGLDKSHPAVESSAASMAAVAPKTARETLDTNSPSVVFEDIGGMAAAGFSMGLRGGQGDVARAVDDMIRTPRGAGGGASAGGGAPVSVSVRIDRVDVHAGGSDRGSMEEAARAFTTTLRPVLTSLLEEIGAEMGAGR
jgi:hypothetical protein